MRKKHIARSAVHYSAVCERFSPYDASLDIATAKELTDSKLSAACSLHAASASSSSSSNSLRRRRLNEIAEEEEEREKKRQSVVHEERPKSSGSQSSTSSSHHTPLDPEKITSPPETTFSSLREPPNFNGVNGAERPTSSARSETVGRLSSQSARPDIHSYASYTYGKPKVKLGPRPSLDANKRPHTAGNFHPVAALPAGFKGVSKGSKKEKEKEKEKGKGKAEDRSQGETEQRKGEDMMRNMIPTASHAMLEVPKEAEAQSTLPPRPNTSSGASIKSLTPSVANSLLQSAKEGNKMTPEKARLMKAMKMREKKKRMGNAATSAESHPLPTVQNNAVTVVEEEPEKVENEQPSKDTESKDQPAAKTHSDPVDPPTPKSINTETRSYDTTTSDSHPPSPTAPSMSEVGKSTKASSLSDSTDETVQDNNNNDNDNNNGNNNDNSNNKGVKETATESATASDDKIDDGAQDAQGRRLGTLGDATGLGLRPVETGESAPGYSNSKPTPEDPQAETLEEGGLGGLGKPGALSDLGGALDGALAGVSGDATSTAISQKSKESQQIPVPHTTLHQTTEREEEQGEEEEGAGVSEPNLPPASATADAIIADADAQSQVLTNHPTRLRTTGLDLSSTPDQDESPRSVLGIPRSKFSTSDPKSATTTSSSSTSRSPIASAPKLRSKFSTQDLKDASPAASSPLSLASLPTRSLAAEKSQPVIGEKKDEPIREKKVKLEIPQQSAQRQSSLEPRSTDVTNKSTPQSEVTDPLLDDALMEELQTAEVQEARPVVVSKSPISPVFPVSDPLNSSQDAPDDTTKNNSHLVRTVSNPVRSPMLGPNDVSQSSARSVSAGDAANLTRQPSNASTTGLPSKKGGIGSSISQRIKALEKMSGSTAPGEDRPKTATPTSSFYTVRRATIRQTSGSSTVADRASSLTRSPNDTPKPPAREAYEKHKRGRSGSMANRLTMFEPMGLQAPPPRGRPESIQVTARILRDPNEPQSAKTEPPRSIEDYGQVELKESPLIIDVRKSDPETEPATATIEPRTDESHEGTLENGTSQDADPTSEDAEKKSRRPSLGVVKDFIKDRRASVISKSSDNLLNMGSPGKNSTRPPSAHSNLARRLSTSSRRSISYDRDTNPTPSMSPGLSDASGDDDKSDKKSAKNRASRFMRRLSSSFTGSSRKNTAANISPTLTEEPANEAAAVSATNTPPEPSATVSAHIGDVNVQFPDNLLWKRRSMCLDSHGWLILTAVQSAPASVKEKAGVKRYHLSEFRLPYAPDVEVQELPNSVRLDLVEGSCLQIACESRNGQLSALQCEYRRAFATVFRAVLADHHNVVLEDAHRKYAALGH